MVNKDYLPANSDSLHIVASLLNDFQIDGSLPHQGFRMILRQGQNNLGTEVNLGLQSPIALQGVEQLHCDVSRYTLTLSQGNAGIL